MARDISVLEAAQMVEEGRAVLLDVRDPDEWTTVRAPGAMHLPMRQLSTSAHLLPDQLLACICHVGMRSSIVAEALVGAGYDAVNVRGGMEAWEAAGLPVEHGRTQHGRLLDRDADFAGEAGS